MPATAAELLRFSWLSSSISHWLWPQYIYIYIFIFLYNLMADWNPGAVGWMWLPVTEPIIGWRGRIQVRIECGSSASLRASSFDHLQKHSKAKKERKKERREGKKKDKKKSWRNFYAIVAARSAERTILMDWNAWCTLDVIPEQGNSTGDTLLFLNCICAIWSCGLHFSAFF